MPSVSPPWFSPLCKTDKSLYEDYLRAYRDWLHFVKDGRTVASQEYSGTEVSGRRSGRLAVGCGDFVESHTGKSSRSGVSSWRKTSVHHGGVGKRLQENVRRDSRDCSEGSVGRETIGARECGDRLVESVGACTDNVHCNVVAVGASSGDGGGGRRGGELGVAIGLPPDVDVQEPIEEGLSDRCSGVGNRSVNWSRNVEWRQRRKAARAARLTTRGRCLNGCCRVVECGSVMVKSDSTGVSVSGCDGARVCSVSSSSNASVPLSAKSSVKPESSVSTKVTGVSCTVDLAQADCGEVAVQLARMKRMDALKFFPAYVKKALISEYGLELDEEFEAPVYTLSAGHLKGIQDADGIDGDSDIYYDI